MNNEQRNDLLIVGAGVVGLACAWRAARAGISVAVLERDRVAAGASGVAAGMLAPVGEASWGEEGLLAFNLASLRRWDDFAAELEADAGAGFGYRRIGALHVAADRDEAEQLRHRHRVHRRHGLDARWLRPSECRRLEPGLTSAIAGGVEAPHEASVEPARLCAALATAVRTRGSEIFEGAEVVAAEPDRGGWTVRTDDDREFSAGTLVVSAGVWSAADWLPVAARPPLRPVKGEIVTLQGSPRDPVCERIVAGERVYMVPREDGRLMIGATVEERGFDTTVTAGGVHELLREGYRLLPEIAELELAEIHAGLRPGTPDNLPLVGEAGGGLVLACGHFRNGVLQAPATADAVAAILSGDEPGPELAPLSPDRFGSRSGRAEPERTEAVAR
jgi:glycine oxidase